MHSHSCVATMIYPPLFLWLYGPVLRRIRIALTSVVGNTYSTYPNMKKPCIFPQCIGEFPEFLTASSYYFPKQRYPVLGNIDMCFSWRWEQNFTISFRWSSCFKTIIQWDASGNICEVGTNSSNSSHSTNTNTLNTLYCIAMLKCI